VSSALETPAPLSPRPAPAGFTPAIFILGLAASVFALFHWDAFRHASVFGLWNLFDWHDIHVYFMSSAWVDGPGKLYHEVPSEYPLLANLLFAAVRLVSRIVPLAEAYDRFAWAWATIALGLYLWTLRRLMTHYPWPAPLLWLTPSALHFSVYRFDVYAVVLALFAVEAIRSDRLWRASLLLGLVTALKGYSLFLLPAYLYYVNKRWGGRHAAINALLYLGPFVLGNLATLAFSGMDGLMYAYKFHASRSFNGESTYDALAYTIGPGLRDLATRIPKLPVMLQAAGALLAIAFQPRTPQQLMRAFLFATTMFVSFSVFYSPQFVLWLVPFVAEWTLPWVSWLVVVLSWVTFGYFPIAFFRKARHPEIFQLAVSATTVARTMLLAAVLFNRPRERGTAPPPRGGEARP
jgi:uncharacterized membrane protein